MQYWVKSLLIIRLLGIAVVSIKIVSATNNQQTLISAPLSESYSSKMQVTKVGLATDSIRSTMEMSHKNRFSIEEIIISVTKDATSAALQMMDEIYSDIVLYTETVFGEIYQTLKSTALPLLEPAQYGLRVLCQEAFESSGSRIVMVTAILSTVTFLGAEWDLDVSVTAIIIGVVSIETLVGVWKLFGWGFTTETAAAVIATILIFKCFEYVKFQIKAMRRQSLVTNQTSQTDINSDNFSHQSDSLELLQRDSKALTNKMNSLLQGLRDIKEEIGEAQKEVVGFKGKHNEIMELVQCNTNMIHVLNWEYT